MRPGDKTSSEIDVVEAAPQFKAVGETFWGYDAARQEDVVLVEVRRPTFIMTNDTNGAPHVLAHEVHDPLTKGTQLLVYRLKGLRRSAVEGGGNWLGGPIDALRRQRLYKVAQLVNDLERWQKGGDTFFNPYLCPTALLIGTGDSVYLFGAAIDFKFEDDPFLGPDLRRFIDPAYLGQRRKGSDFAPGDDERRLHYMRYGVVQMLLEAALNRVYDPDRNETVDFELLAPEWQPARLLLERYFDPQTVASAAGQEDGLFLDTFKQLAKGVAVTPVSARVPVAATAIAVGSNSGTILDPFGDAPITTPITRTSLDPFDGDDDDKPPDDGNGPSIPASDEPREDGLGDSGGDPLPTTPTRVGHSAIKVFAAATFALLIGAAAVLLILCCYGVNPLHPGELREVTAQRDAAKQQLQASDRQMKAYKLQSLLLRWGLEPNNRAQIESEVSALSPGNLNLRYFKLSLEVGRVDPVKWVRDSGELRKDFANGQKGEPFPGGNPSVAFFTLADLDQLDHYADVAAKRP